MVIRRRPCGVQALVDATWTSVHLEAQLETIEAVQPCQRRRHLAMDRIEREAVAPRAGQAAQGAEIQATRGDVLREDVPDRQVPRPAAGVLDADGVRHGLTRLDVGRRYQLRDHQIGLKARAREAVELVVRGGHLRPRFLCGVLVDQLRHQEDEVRRGSLIRDAHQELSLDVGDGPQGAMRGRGITDLPDVGVGPARGGRARSVRVQQTVARDGRGVARVSVFGGLVQVDPHVDHARSAEHRLQDHGRRNGLHRYGPAVRIQPIAHAIQIVHAAGDLHRGDEVDAIVVRRALVLGVAELHDRARGLGETEERAGEYVRLGPVGVYRNESTRVGARETQVRLGVLQPLEAGLLTSAQRVDLLEVAMLPEPDRKKGAPAER